MLHHTAQVTFGTFDEGNIVVRRLASDGKLRGTMVGFGRSTIGRQCACQWEPEEDWEIDVDKPMPQLDCYELATVVSESMICVPSAFLLVPTSQISRLQSAIAQQNSTSSIQARSL